MKLPKSTNLIFGILISLVFLYLAVRKVDFAEFRKSITGVQYGFALTGLFAGVLSYLVRAWRWRFFLSGIKKINISRLFSATLIGFMANNLLPVRAGELFRVLVVNRKESVSFSAVLGSLVAERAMDGITISLIAFGSLWFLPIQNDIKMAVGAFFGVFAALILLLLMLAKFESVRKILFSFLPAGISKLTENFILGLKGLSNPTVFFVTFIGSFPIWIFSVLYFYLIEISMDIHLPFSSSIAILISVAIGVAIPSSPGFIGVYHFFCQKALEMYGIEPSVAFGFAVVSHILQYIGVILLGMFFLFYENLSLSDMNFENSKEK
ncbi:MAG TPA: lysylphosphatidylglycerol synthase transmembrane domain-containing protein [bacterium]